MRQSEAERLERKRSTTRSGTQLTERAFWQLTELGTEASTESLKREAGLSRRKPKLKGVSGRRSWPTKLS